MSKRCRPSAVCREAVLQLLCCKLVGSCPVFDLISYFYPAALRQLAATILHNFSPLPHPRPASLAAAHKLPSRPSGAPPSPFPQSRRRRLTGEKKTKGMDRGKVQSRVALARPHHRFPGPRPPRAITRFPLALPTRQYCATSTCLTGKLVGGEGLVAAVTTYTQTLQLGLDN